MRLYKNLFITAILAAMIAMPAAAQNEQSPYSKFGYGMVKDYATSIQRSMGGVGIAMTGGRQINVMNPASYAGIDSLTLLWDIGVDLTRLWSKENDATGKSFGGGLDYLTMQFPIGKYLGGSFGLVPYSSVGYSFGGEINDDDGNPTGTTSFTGAGGLNELYIGLSGRLFKGLTIGANVAYQFGTIVNDSYITDATSGTANTLFEQSMEIRDWNILLGIQYTKEFRQLHKFTIGATYSPKKDFHGKTWGTNYDINADVAPDTIAYMHMNGEYTKPNSYGAGLSYTYDDRLTIEGDFTYQDWSKAKFGRLLDNDGNPVSEMTTFDDRWKAALGMQFIPKLRGNYLQRIAYRCGAYYTRDYIMIGGNHIREYGASIGFGLPTLGTKTIINLGLEYKRRSAYPASNLVSENYFNITIGVNFNEFAFWQDKIR